MEMPAPTDLTPLGRHEDRFWPADPAAYGTRAAQRGGRYRVFIPSPIAGASFSFDNAAVTAIAEAVHALQRLDETPPALATVGSLARNLLRSESVASSRIEGLRISHKRLARAAFEDQHRQRRDNRAMDVLGNVEAMEHAIELGAQARSFDVSDIEDIHRALLHHTEDAGIAGKVRDEQSWIGGNDHNPIGATYVPPPPEHVLPLLEDLCQFIGRDDTTAVAQAAIAHAQFENIHPFADGNGRTGRAMIYTILRRRGATVNYIPPISLVLAREPKSYIGGIGAYSAGNVSVWCGRFANATARAAQGARRLAAEIEARQTAWLEHLANPRSDAAVRRIISALPAQPVIDVPAGRRITGKSHVSVGKAFDQLETIGVLKRLNENEWGRIWECDELLDLAESFEKTLAAS